MAVSGHFRQRSKFWGLLRGLTEIYGSFFVLNVWRLSLRSYITVKKLIGSLVAMVTRSKLVIFSRILTTQFFQGYSSSVAIQHRWTAIIPLCRAGNSVLQLLSELFAICSKFPSGSPQTSNSVRSLMLTLTKIDAKMAIVEWVFKLGAWFFLHLVAPLQVFKIYNGFSPKLQGDLLANRQKWLFCVIFHKNQSFWSSCEVWLNYMAHLLY